MALCLFWFDSLTTFRCRSLALRFALRALHLDSRKHSGRCQGIEGVKGLKMSSDSRARRGDGKTAPPRVQEVDGSGSGVELRQMSANA